MCKCCEKNKSKKRVLIWALSAIVVYFFLLYTATPKPSANPLAGQFVVTGRVPGLAVSPAARHEMENVFVEGE